MSAWFSPLAVLVWGAVSCSVLPGCTPLIPPLEDDSAGGQQPEKILFDPAHPQMSNGPIRLALIQKPGSAAWRPFNSVSMSFLRDRIEQYTDFQVELIDGGAGVSLADERLLEVPVIFVDSAPEESDGESLARYLLAGGFALGDLSGTVVDAMQRSANLVPGKDIWSEQLSKTQPIFSCFYDLRKGVTAVRRGSAGGGKSALSSWETTLTFTGYFVQGRLAGLSSQPHLSWNQYRSSTHSEDLSSPLKMVINAMVYALSQPDSMSRRSVPSDDPESEDSILIEK